MDNIKQWYFFLTSSQHSSVSSSGWMRLTGEVGRNKGDITNNTRGFFLYGFFQSAFIFYSVTTCLCMRREQYSSLKIQLVSVLFNSKITIKQVWPFESQLHGLLTQKGTRYHLGNSLEKCFHCAAEMNAKYLFFELVHNSTLSWNWGWGHVEDICTETIMMCAVPKVRIILFHD